MLGCPEFDDLVSAYADGETVPAQREFLQLHLATCGRCQAALARHRNTRRLLQSALDDRWVPPDLSERVARAYRRSRGIPRLTAVIARAGIGIAALLVVTSLLVGRVGLLHSGVFQASAPTATTSSPGPCGPCSAKLPVKYARVRGHEVPALLVSEVAYDLDSAVPLSQVGAELLPTDRLDELLRQATAESKGGDAGRGLYTPSYGPIPM